MNRAAIALTSQIFMAVGTVGFVFSLLWNKRSRERKEREL